MPKNMNQATVRKLVRVGGGMQGKCSDRMFQSGYGLLRNESGEIIYFVDSVVENDSFLKLEVGNVVYYTLEDGPFLRAAAVRFARKTSTELSVAFKR